MSFCKHCGNQLADTVNYCPSCGTAVNSNSLNINSSFKPRNSTLEEPISVGEYVVIYLLFSIPIVNIIMLIKWSLGFARKQNLINMARGKIVIFVAYLVLALFVFMAIGLSEL